MWQINRKTKYEIIKKIVNDIDPKVLNELICKSNFKGYQETDDVIYRKSEILKFLDEIYEYWCKNNIDLTDRQYIKVVDTNEKAKTNSTCVIFKDEEEEKLFSQITQDINHGNNPKIYTKNR